MFTALTSLSLSPFFLSLQTEGWSIKSLYCDLLVEEFKNVFDLRFDFIYEHDYFDTNGSYPKWPPPAKLLDAFEQNKTLFEAPIPGLSFKIPKVLMLGPSLALFIHNEVQTFGRITIDMGVR